MAVACVATGAVMFAGTLAGAKAGAKAPDVKWQVTPEQKARIVALRPANFMHFFEACPLNDEDDTPVVEPELDAHIQRHEDLDAHYPFTATQHKRVLELATQAGTPGFIAMLICDAPAKRSTADMDAYIEAHAPIAAKIEQQWEDCKRVRELWWIYKHHESDEVVTYKDPSTRDGVDGVAKRFAEQDEAHEADFPGAAAKREEIRRLGKEAEQRVKEMKEAWGLSGNNGGSSANDGVVTSMAVA